MTEPDNTAIDVLVCTYRRPELLARTLDGIARCAAGLPGIRVIVVDNDVRQSARTASQAWALRSGLALDYLSQPVQNISLSRNLALDRARAPWVACIDDDEVPGPEWLRGLLGAARHYRADVVFGPVISEFDRGAPAWATQGSLFQRRRFPTGTLIPHKEMRTGNVLLRRECLREGRFRFDPALGLSGGEDSDFFARLTGAGCRAVWCDEAWVREWTPGSRTRLAWVLKRAFRIGSVDAYNKRRLHRLREGALAALKCGAFLAQGSVLALFWAPLSRTRCVQAMFRAVMGAGYFYGLVKGPYQEYRQAAATPQGDAR
jgi:succinoglycan biosynthesis protein ExoM